jgi:hypothetical protein
MQKGFTLRPLPAAKRGSVMAIKSDTTLSEATQSLTVMTRDRLDICGAVHHNPVADR